MPCADENTISDEDIEVSWANAPLTAEAGGGELQGLDPPPDGLLRDPADGGDILDGEQGGEGCFLVLAHDLPPLVSGRSVGVGSLADTSPLFAAVF